MELIKQFTNVLECSDPRQLLSVAGAAGMASPYWPVLTPDLPEKVAFAISQYINLPLSKYGPRPRVIMTGIVYAYMASLRQSGNYKTYNYQL
jgi:hypothetical protein